MRIFFFVLSFFACPSFLTAHHSVTAFFDRATIIEVEGTITEIFWRNPHVFLTLEVIGEE